LVQPAQRKILLKPDNMRTPTIIAYFVICCGITIVTIGCQHQITGKDVRNVISVRATSTDVLADGSSLDTLYADLDISSENSALGVTFRAASGLFRNGFDTLSVFANRTDIDPKKITAVAIWQASLRGGTDTVYASTSTNPQYTDSVILTLTPSLADSILLIPSSYTLKDTFGMEVTVTATLFNSVGGMVSLGANIQFSDLSAGGMFQPPVAVSDSSKVSTFYFPKLLQTGSSTGVQDTIVATITAPSGRTIATGRTIIYISP
jgi:hypothetical protein